MNKLLLAAVAVGVGVIAFKGMVSAPPRPDAQAEAATGASGTGATTNEGRNPWLVALSAGLATIASNSGQ